MKNTEEKECIPQNKLVLTINIDLILAHKNQQQSSKTVIKKKNDSYADGSRGHSC